MKKIETFKFYWYRTGLNNVSVSNCCNGVFSPIKPTGRWKVKGNSAGYVELFIESEVTIQEKEEAMVLHKKHRFFLKRCKWEKVIRHTGNNITIKVWVPSKSVYICTEYEPFEEIFTCKGQNT